MRQGSVAVIGAGAAGLAAARELLREGHKVTVLEQNSRLGGVWVFDERVEKDDLLGQNSKRGKVHSSMYRHLRTNLPRELMGFSDFPFIPELLGSRSVDARRFCSHTEVLNYLEAFADYFKVKDCIRFNNTVLNVRQLFTSTDRTGTSNNIMPWQRWVVTSECEGSDIGVTESHMITEEYDAVVICNGHNSEPSLPDIKGMDMFTGFQMHSHNYRDPEQFKGQVVLVVGAANSGEDISREVASVASQVHVCARSWKQLGLSEAELIAPYGPRRNIHRHPDPIEITQEGNVVFSDGSHLDGELHTIIYCTGFQYKFPFLFEREELSHSSGLQHATEALTIGHSSPYPVVTVKEQRVDPLWLHIFPPSSAPGMSFLGLTRKTVPFPQLELQAKLVARALSGRIMLPRPEVMKEEIMAFYEQLKEDNVPTKYTHMQVGQAQWDYNNKLAALCGEDVPETPSWRMKMAEATGLIKTRHAESYRDVPNLGAESENVCMLQEARTELELIAKTLSVRDFKSDSCKT
ncbi:hypothetical protein CEUSTIGMA_g7294.t1 [Chlamydomonas eustigma]|uniref:Flavin-containing monooxygenase n=1 Tax=Chlamydomonas eustigma TaxID=1157962 RepID=A0A250X9V9_9CHLO|nr:hypothetical protein CEUSTIGMA_g7294.t1 [Chlamydomonas eustigma]|eukprot:GAX79854.1 hypothetical protein CEUSTIGMA_g7294.t1 [Chlamydomonas eustigma]